MSDATTPFEQRGSSDGNEDAVPLDAPSFPWPPAEDASIIGAFVRTWQGATLQPTSFFRALPEHGTIGAALLYYLPLGILISGAELFWQAVRTPTEYEAMLGLGANGAFSPLVTFLLSPLLLLISLFLSAAVTHLLLKLFGGAHRDFSVSTRVFAYAHSPMLFGVVPLIGTPIGFVWMVAVAVVGLREAHRTTTSRAAAAVIIPVVIGLFLLGIALLLRAAGTLLETPL